MSIGYNLFDLADCGANLRLSGSGHNLFDLAERAPYNDINLTLVNPKGYNLFDLAKIGGSYLTLDFGSNSPNDGTLDSIGYNLFDLVDCRANLRLSGSGHNFFDLAEEASYNDINLTLVNPRGCDLIDLAKRGCGSYLTLDFGSGSPNDNPLDSIGYNLFDLVVDRGANLRLSGSGYNLFDLAEKASKNRINLTLVNPRGYNLFDLAKIGGSYLTLDFGSNSPNYNLFDLVHCGANLRLSGSGHNLFDLAEEAFDNFIDLTLVNPKGYNLFDLAKIGGAYLTIDYY